MTAKLAAELVVGALAALIVLLGLNTVFGWLSDPFHLKAGKLAHAQTEAAQGHADAAVAKGQAGAGADAARIVDLGRARLDATLHIEQRNRDEILSAPGAADRLDPELVRRARRGLCEYRSVSADPGCAALRPAGPE